jgi:hypothetical protein
VKHVKIINREDKEGLPLAAAPCNMFNICFLGDWEACDPGDFCIKDGERPADNTN